MKRLLFLVFLLLPLLLQAAGPPPGTFIVPSFFTTNAAKIYGTNGIGVSSNAVTGIYLIDGKNLTNGFSPFTFNPNHFLVVGSDVSIKSAARLTNMVSVGAIAFGGYSINDLGHFVLSGGTFDDPIGDDLGTSWLINPDGSAFFGSGFFGIDLLGNISGSAWNINDDGSGSLGANLISFTTLGEMNGTGLTWQWLHTTKGITNEGPYVGAVLTNTFTDILGTGQIALTNGVANEIAKFKSVQPGSGMLATNQGTNVVFAWDHTMTNGLATTTYADSAGVRALNLQSNGFGGTVGGSSNLVLLIGDTNGLSLNATNISGTNTASFTLAQALTTASSPTFANITISANAKIQANAPTLTTFPDTKNMSLISTSTTGGLRFQSVVPMVARRKAAWGMPIGGAIQGVGLNLANVSASPTDVGAATNNWSERAYTTSSAANSDGGLYENNVNNFFPGKDNYYACVARVSQTSTQRVWIGLGGTVATLSGTATPTTLSVAAVRQDTSAADTNWCFVTCDAANCTVTTMTSLVDTNYHLFEIREDYANHTWYCYMDRVCKATNTLTNPIGAMQTVETIRNLGAIAKTIRMQVVYTEQDATTITSLP